MKPKVIILFLLVVVSVSGWCYYAFQKFSAKQATKEEISRAFPKDSYAVFMVNEKLTLYALKPESQNTNADNFHGFGILSKTEIDTKEHQKELKTAFVEEMAGAKSAACFNPRHALRAEANGKMIDLAISFECGKFIVYAGDETGEGGISGSNLEQPFNQILQNAGIRSEK